MRAFRGVVVFHAGPSKAWETGSNLAHPENCVIVGAGHNGLAAAYYLARAGFVVTVLERTERVGGGAVTDELFPGYRIGTCAYVCHMLQRRIIDDMQLRRHGLHIYPLDPSGVFLYPNGDSLRFWHDHERLDEEIALLSPGDRGAWPKWMEFWKDAARLFQRYFLSEPPTFDEVARDVAGTRYEAVWERLLNVPVRSMAEEFFEDPRIAAAAIGSGDYGAISKPGSALAQTFFKMSFLTADEDLGIVRGGMGGITQAMAKTACEAGVEIRTNAPVNSIIVRNGRATGVRLETDEEIEADIVVSNADPKSTFMCLVDEDALPPGFPEKVQALSTRSASLKLHAVLKRLPDFSRYLRADDDDSLIAMVRIMPTPDYIESSWRDAMNGTPTRYPIMQLQIPTVFDPTLAPAGGHVMSIWVTYEPVRPRAGTWPEIRRDVGYALLDELERYLPDIRDCIEEWDVFTPADIGERVGMTDGNIRHLDLSPDQLLANRTLPGCAPYRTPVSGLYMCGSGMHPGGEVTGAPGHNAAHAIIKELLRK